jgi:hypothetical protein
LPEALQVEWEALPTFSKSFIPGFLASMNFVKAGHDQASLEIRVTP